MKVSAKGDYATRAMQDLALHYEKGPIQIEDIARRQHLPARYLEQILLSLKRAGFLESKRGVSGGYYLAKHPREITVGAIIRTMEGPIIPIFCVGSGPREICIEEPRCGLRDLWADVRDAVVKIVDHTTLEDLSRQIRTRQEREGVSYQI
ncbi:transcriptional regulator [Candidatus Methylomirabilis limnetica]|jgi:Rrf2 family protein|uniref:Transcriptional regulator n=1 Tax=Candidatus Methylomirabilis limnetica TaxID=2033718 RepID=A0A2T4TY07_9BACT|nr:Rrf2 family transcriptional regulator [Candidatus Methylomirabilis limnetica]PTL36011.1 transcriptional regulator [Candidatus Methylomirabilis limnetica]